MDLNKSVARCMDYSSVTVKIPLLNIQRKFRNL